MDSRFLGTLLYTRAMQRVALLVAGPVGCSILYYLIFIVRPFDADRYPNLAQKLTPLGFLIEALLGCIVILASVIHSPSSSAGSFQKGHRSLPVPVLAGLTVITAALMAYTFYRVFGTLDPNEIMGEYQRYYAVTRRGGAWVIWAGYGILYIFLADMFFGYVNKYNASFFLFCILMNSVTGGRTLPLLCMLAFLFLLYFQRPRITVLLSAIIACSAIGISSYMIVSSLREGRPTTAAADAPEVAAAPEDDAGNERKAAPAPPTNDWKSLNYNAAFILDDVLRQLDGGTISLHSYFFDDFNLFVPRFLNPDKLRSDSETRIIYPKVAERGTTITFPLKANLMIHFGTWTYYLNWIVVLGFQIGLIWSMIRRQAGPTLTSFTVFFFGCMYFLIERAGLLNTRLIIHLVGLLVAYGCYRIATMGWFVDLISFASGRSSHALQPRERP